jgi:signal transduction histidine kinase
MVIRNSRDNNAAWINESGEYQRSLLIASFKMRALSIFLALVCAGVLKNFIKVNIPVQIMWVFWVWLATSLIYLYILRAKRIFRKKALNEIHFSYYFIGVTYSTIIVHYLGGAEWIAFFVYIFDLIYANVLLDRRRGAVITGFIYVCYFGLIFLEYAGIIPHYRIMPLEAAVYSNLTYIMSTNVVIIGMTYLLVSCSTGLFSKMKEDRERVLIDSKNRFAVKSRQLENLGASLRRQIEENRQLKTATMDYIGKKESELNSARKDLEGQIDKMRKTQRSMYFMIEDLNHMSRELKASRDNLEEKVRRRTDELLTISNKLHRSERLAFLGKLAGSITHELRNPMAVLKNAAYFLDGKLKGSKEEKVLKYIEIIKKEIGIIDSIVEDVMGFARTKTPDLKDRDIAGVVEEAISALNVPDLVEIRKEFQDLPQVQADDKQLTHAVINIANNAIVAMGGNGILIFRVGKRDGYVAIDITDTGPGIPHDQRDLIFEPLYSSKPKGTGLGLPIAKMMIESQDGKITFTSEVGVGTTFSILLPIERLKRTAKNGE